MARLASIQKEIEELNNKEAELLKLQGYYSSDEFLEKEARRILSYQKPGEEVYVVISKKRNDPEINIKNGFKVIEGNGDQEEVSNPTKWWNYFFNNVN